MGQHQNADNKESRKPGRGGLLTFPSFLLSLECYSLHSAKSYENLKDGISVLSLFEPVQIRQNPCSSVGNWIEKEHHHRDLRTKTGGTRMFDLHERVALVTGGGRGIGRAIALALAEAGASVAVTARTTPELNEVVAGIQGRKGQALAISADLSERSAPMKVVRDVVAAFGRIDILVNNAGIGSSSNPKPVFAFDDDFWDLSLALNLTAPYLLCKAVLPAMTERKWGRIINIASINGKIGSLHGAAYAATKHGLLGLTRTLALEVAREGVTVNAICPGPVHTVMNDRRLVYDSERLGIPFEKIEQSLTPIGRRLEPDEVAPLAVYLASAEARMVTGQAWNVCGGMLMT
jgi:NAD(P)-dependent dehydrogenase (short-subunit alcohol dehydrogenase family)